MTVFKYLDITNHFTLQIAQSIHQVSVYAAIIGITCLPFVNVMGVFFRFIEITQELTLMLYLNMDLPLNFKYMLSFLKYYQLSFLLPFFLLPSGDSYNKRELSDKYDALYPDEMFLYNNVSSSFIINASSLLFVSHIIPMMLIGFIKLTKRYYRIENIKNEKIKRLFEFFETLMCYNLLFFLFQASNLEMSLYLALQLKNAVFNNVFNVISFILALIYMLYMIFMINCFRSISNEIIKKEQENPFTEKCQIPASYLTPGHKNVSV